MRKLAPDAMVCLECNAVIKKQGKLYDTSPLQMPPVIFDLTPEFWEQIKPWPRMPFKIARTFGWYVSMLYGRFYLVMPVFEKGKGPVFYSARCVVWGGQDCPKKYKYTTPENRERKMWASGGKGKYVLVGEGVADAAYLSQIAPSVALLGSYGELSLRKPLLVMDGDAKGIEAAFRIMQLLRKKGVVAGNVVTLPPGKDPTDLTLEQLRRLIKAQTGVKL